MADAQREHDALAEPPTTRETRIEELLLAGLDHYFRGQYELAVSVWTRVLFLDRSHARARAYIERARGAIAERQREGEELLQTGAAAFQRGDAAGARRLLTSAVERGASPDEALALLDRLDRISPAGDIASASDDARQRRRHDQILTTGRQGARAITLLLMLALGVAAGILVMIYWSTTAPSWIGERVRVVTPAPHPTEEPLPVPLAADVALVRAHALYARGRLREALGILETIRPGDARRVRADELRTEIQHHLLDTARFTRPSSPFPSNPAR